MNKKITALSVTASSLVNASGIGKEHTLNAIKNNTSSLRKTGYPGLDFDTYLGIVDLVDKVEIEKDLKRFSCRNNKLTKLALDADNFRDHVSIAADKYGKNRIGVFMGTSTSGVSETEYAYKCRDKNSKKLPYFDMLSTDNISSIQDYVTNSLGLSGVGLAISTACSSSAKVFASAYRYIEAGLCDAAVVGGVDSLCLTTLYGFNSLQLISPEPCKPWDKNRSGINIGEAAGFILLEKTTNDNFIKLAGYGESSDAYHISSPHPNGDGAKIAMQDALSRANINTKDIDYINLHGTATPANDKTEARAIYDLFSNSTDCSSTKGITGHTLGAAGINEAIICALAIKENIIPGNVNLTQTDPNLPIEVSAYSKKKIVNYVMSNSFGFGGSNCSLIFSC